MVAAAAVLVTPASAQVTWTVTPEGPFTGTAGETVLTTESGVELFCESSTADGTAQSGENPIGLLPTPGIVFNNCQGPFGFTFEVNHVGTWELHGDTYDAATGVTTGRITAIEAEIVGPDCLATVTGFVNVTYTNGSGQLLVIPDPTLTISEIDPATTCGGLMTVGETATFDGTYLVDPVLTVTQP